MWVTKLMLRTVFAALLCVTFAADASAQDNASFEPDFSVTRIKLDQFQDALINETELSSASFQLVISVPGDVVPPNRTDAYFNRVIRQVIDDLSVRTPPASASDKLTGPTIGSVADVTWSSEAGNAKTDWILLVSGIASVSGSQLIQIERSLLDYITPINLQIQVVYIGPSGTVQGSNWETLAFRPRIFAITQWAMLLIATVFLMTLSYLLSRMRLRRHQEERIDELEFELAGARRKVNIAESSVESPIEDGSKSDPHVPLPEIPPTLLEAIADGRAMVAFGAGASIQAGLPTSYELVFELEQELGDSLSARLRDNIRYYARTGSQKRDTELFSNIMSAIAEQVTRHRLAFAMQDIFSRRLRRSDTFHKKVAGISWSGALSMTWDDLGYQAFNDSLPNLVHVAATDHERLRQALGHDESVFIRGWGNLDDAQDIILSFEDLRETFEERPEFRQQLIYLLQDRCFLFVGISPSSLREYLTTLDPYLEVPAGQHFTLVPASYENELFERQLAQYGVQLIEYDPSHGHAQAGEFLDALRVQAPERVTHRSKAMSLTRWEPLTKLEMKNIGPFDQLTVKLAQRYEPGREKQGFPWTVVTGPNGSGKSVVLRALAVALSAHDDRIRRQAGGLLKIGERTGQISITVGDKTYHVDLVRDDGSVDGVRITSRQRTPLAVGATLVLGFPALRGAPSGDPSGPRDVIPKPPGARDVYPLALNLVDDRMLDFKQWVVNVYQRARGGEAGYERVLTVLDKIVAEILPGGVLGLVVPPRTYAVRVRIRNPRDNRRVTEVPFDQMSQGMSSVFNWVGVFLQRVHETFDDISDLTEIPATVIVDEIDVHLHPAWQRRVVALVKHTFPKVQVIASTHSALIVSSLYREEIRLFSEVDPSIYNLHPPSRETFGLDATELIQGETLDVNTARSAEFDAMVAEYNKLDDMPNRNDDEERRLDNLHTQLRDAGWEGILRTPASNLTTEDAVRLKRKFSIRFSSDAQD